MFPLMQLNFYTSQSKKKTLLSIPHVAIDANRILALAAAFPPSSPVDRDLFEEVDSLIPDSVRAATLKA